MSWPALASLLVLCLAHSPRASFFRSPFPNADFEPYGSDYFGQPSGRWSNGRLFIDIITQGLGIGMLSPYLKSLGSNFTRGVSFASSGSTAQNSTAVGTNSGGLFTLLVQIDQFREFQDYVLLQKKGVSEKLQMRQHFSNSVYLIETAHNDYIKVAFKTEEFDPIALMVAVISAMRIALQALFDLGARIFLVMNVTPLGCNPSTASNPYRTENRDEYGCKVDYLTLVNMHNDHLVELLSEFRLKYPMAHWILFDAYSIMLDGYHNPSKYGVKYPFRACCGYGGGTYNYDEDIQCGQAGEYINGTYAEATKCEDPSLYIIWDSLHPVESFCHHLAQGVLDGTHLSPYFNVTEKFKMETHAQI
ncbi:hypothetical protein GOP47_0019758 [Adiantum capillus-veneris]|uniref:GDSL esterase/lipase n=1 Tax=Adiantum capillus-veneris TaxID=13818 RepID=A0A9D4Z7C7_ADICA|nr:hypothetical protein GOP47_0019758 [Adiantum capillus-veneris]